MSGLKQPVLGILATALIMAISLGFISLFDFPKFSGWIATFLLCIIPMEIVMGVTWGMKQPRFVAERSQPVRGILFSLIALVAGVIVVLVALDRRRHRRQPSHADFHAMHDRFGGHHVLDGDYVGRLAIHGFHQESNRGGSGDDGGLLCHQLHLFPHLL